MTRVTTPSREAPPTFVDWTRTRSPTSGMGRFPWRETWSDARVRTLLFDTVTRAWSRATSRGVRRGIAPDSPFCATKPRARCTKRP